MPSQRLVLIDGSSYLYRAFHALPPLSNAAGEPTGALFGVVNMLRTTLADRPQHVAFVLDAPGPTFRNEIFPEYKANREAMPDDLRAQIEPLLEIVTALGLPLLRIPGVEADDVIGTLAAQGAAQGMQVLVSTSDKDFAQLVDERITLVNTMSNTRRDAAQVQERYGVRPDQFVDFLALVGDKSDNIPGVPGCGEKTAARWLAKYGSLDRIMDAAAEIGGKVGENLRASLEQLPLARELAQIRLDVPLPLDVAQLQVREPDVPRLRALYQRLEFRAALQELDAAPAGGAAGKEPASADAALPDAPPTRYETITTEADLQRWLDLLHAAPLFAIDVETTSLDAHSAQLVGIAFAVEPGHAAYLPLAHEHLEAPAQLPMDATLERLRPLLESPEHAKLAHHGKYDLNVLAGHGIVLRGLLHDTLLQSYVLNPGALRHDMDSLARRHLGRATTPYSEVAGKGRQQIPFSQVDVATAAHYAAEDADITLQLHHALWPQLQATPALQKIYETLEIPLLGVLARMEQAGVFIDTAALEQQSVELTERMQQLAESASACVDREFSLDSPMQLREILFGELQLQATVKTPKGLPSTNEEALSAIADQHELPQLILDYRALAKLRSTYTSKLPAMVNARSGRLHTNYQQAVTSTGRLSSSDPNLQNIPVRTAEGRRIRQAFIAPPGWQVVAADYSQIELRILAHLSGDDGLLSAFAAGQDIHRATAAQVFGVSLEQVDADQRRSAKAINFGLMYGMSAFGLARQLGSSRADAQQWMDRYFERYPGVQAFMESTREVAHRDGYVETMFGRRLYLEGINARNHNVRSAAERAAINAPMQGSAADIIKHAMISIDGWLADAADRARMLMQVHDELVFEVREDWTEKLVEGARERMVAAAQMRTPLVVDIGVGRNWDEAR